MSRQVRDDPDRPATAVPSIEDCLAHRCKEHFRVPSLNDNTSEGAECGACIAEEVSFLEAVVLDLMDVLAARLLASAIRKEHLQRCIDRLNFVSEGAGDQMLAELAEDFRRHTLKRQWIEGRHNAELRGEWLKLPEDHPAHRMALAIEKELWEASGAGANDDGPEHQ